MGPVGRELGLEHLSREGFLRLVDFVLEQIPPARVHAGRRMPPPPSGVPVELYAYPVFDVPLTGGKHLRCGDGDGVAELELHPGEVLFSEPFAWKLPLWDRPHELCCLVFRPECIRITYVDAGSGGRPVCGCFFHTALPPSDTVRKVAGCLAAAPDEARCDLVRALFRMSRAV